MRKLLLILLVLCLLLGNAFAASDEITNLDAQIIVDSNGTCRVMVLAEIRFVTQPTSFVFPLGADAKDITASGASFDHESIDGVKCIVFKNESGFSGTQSFQCTYTLPCTMWENDDGQYFTAKLPEKGWDYPINRFKLSISFPTEITAFPSWQSSYYGDVIDNYLSIQIAENTVTARSNIIFRDHETLTMKLSFAPDAFTLKHLAEKTVPVARLLFLLLYGICIVYWLASLRKGRFITKKNSVFSFQSSAGEVPCQLFGANADLGALIAHWGNLGYILLHRSKRGDFRLEKQMDMGNERSAAERRIFKAIFRSTTYIDVPGPRFLSSVHAELPVLKAHWKHRMFQKQDGRPKVLLWLCLGASFFLSLMIFDTLLDSTAGRVFWMIVLTLLTLPLYWAVQKVVPRYYSPHRWFYLGLGIAATGILFLFASSAECGGFLFFNLLLQLGAGYVTRFGGQRTIPGQEAVGELLSFRKVILHSNKNTAKQPIQHDGQYFYRALPYAEIMGMDSRFLKHFGAVTTESCPWVVDEKSRTASPKEFYELYKELLRSIRSREQSSLLRAFGKNIELTLPRIRPGSGRSSSGRSGSGRSSFGRSRKGGAGSNGAPSGTRNPYRTDTRADARNGASHSHAASGRNAHPRRTQHRANPNRTGRRS
ncbi:MAG: DUF2207 domain-containing protein [Oscillospiraceae bacterium]|nr:DUF2207 domain-containing protein [Oscillospiraceae bacterium]